jgi:hypothetical protein
LFEYESGDKSGGGLDLFSRGGESSRLLLKFSGEDDLLSRDLVEAFLEGGTVGIIEEVATGMYFIIAAAVIVHE